PTRIISGDRTGMIVWDDGRIIVTDGDFDVRRYTRDAVLEQSYDFNHGTSKSILKLPDNRFLIVGYDTGDGQDISVTRHLASGALDTTFGQSGRTLLPVLEGDDQGYRATLQQDGKILIVGSAYAGSEDGWDVAVARLSYDGVPDTNFFTGYNDATSTFAVGNNVSDYGYAILHLPNGKIMVAGRTEQGAIALARLQGDTNQDNAPGNQAPLNQIPSSQETLVETPLAFTEYRGNRISISDPDAGNLEVEMQLEATNGLVTLVNRNLVASGLTYLIGDGLDDTVVKVRGKIDDINTALSWTAFVPNPGYSGEAGQITITTNDLGNVGDGGPQEDVDTIAIEVKTPDDFFDPPPAWKTFPGLLDESFDQDGVRILDAGNTSGNRHDYDRIWNMELLPNGKILAGANVDGYLAMLRFNSDLSLDATFGSGGLVKTALNYSNTNYRSFLAQDAQGRILLAGYRSVYRYLANGSVDTSFGVEGRATLSTNGSQYADYINDIGFQGDGDILVAASFGADNSTQYGGVWRMGEDGQNATRIISGDRTGMIVWDDGRIIVTDGDFDVRRYTRDAVLEQSYD
ncbi:MAG: hypothetical protein GY759_25030, partial [Chloroflexi bacterium]|nr:hypothetical protein [Chloroflexota bacterium]